MSGNPQKFFGIDFVEQSTLAPPWRVFFWEEPKMQAKTSWIALALAAALGIAGDLLIRSLPPGLNLALWAVGDFGWLYFGFANALGLLMVYANYNLIRSGTSLDAWRVYKLSAFPYLGVIFTVLCLDFWI